MFLYGQTPSAPGAGSMFGSLLPLLLVFVIFYLILIMPMRRKQKQHQSLLSNLKGGERVVTAGGIYGTVTRVMDDRFEIQIDGNTHIQVTKSSIAAVVDLVQGDKAK